MKILKLSAAVAGLLMGSAALAGGSCTNANLSAWDDTRDDSGSQVNVVAGGLGGTACRLEVESTGDNSQRGRVQDQSPQCESSFRARFLVNADNLGTLADNERTKLYNVQCVTADTGGAVTCTGVGMAQFRLQGDGGNNILRSWVADENIADLRNRFDVPLAAGENAIEMQWIRASADGVSDGVFRGWWNNSVEASPDVEITNLDNYDYCVTQVNLGLIKATNAWTTAHNGTAVQIDEYESRRQTGIGVQ